MAKIMYYTDSHNGSALGTFPDRHGFIEQGRT